MALKWIVNSALAQVFGHTDNASIQNSNVMAWPSNKVDVQECLKSLKNTKEGSSSIEFEMPLHYPRYTKVDYEKMEEWRVDILLKEYGLNFKGTPDQKRAYAIGAFLWPDQL